MERAGSDLPRARARKCKALKIRDLFFAAYSFLDLGAPAGTKPWIGFSQTPIHGLVPAGAPQSKNECAAKNQNPSFYGLCVFRPGVWKDRSPLVPKKVLPGGWGSKTSDFCGKRKIFPGFRRPISPDKLRKSSAVCVFGKRAPGISGAEGAGNFFFWHACLPAEGGPPPRGKHLCKCGRTPLKWG